MPIALDKAGEAILARVRAIQEVGESKPDWADIARPEQIRPARCDTFVLRGGRGSGKTRAGAEDFLARMRDGVKRLHIIAPTFADARDVCVEGDSGILNCAKPGEVVQWNRSMGELKFASGAVAKCFAAVEPDRLNGPQCSHLWADEFGLYGDTGAIDMALFGLRLGDRVTSCWTSTPKPTKSTKYVLGLAGAVVRTMRMRDNIANLAPGTVEALERKYGGTRLGRQELEGEIIGDVEGALWNRVLLGDPDENGNVLYPEFRRPVVPMGQVVQRLQDLGIVKVAVGVDPTVADPELKRNPFKEMDECGIVVSGVDANGHGYTLADLSGVYHPAQWAKIAVNACNVFAGAVIVAEANNGGELVKMAVKTVSGSAPVQLVHAALGKRARAEPVSMLYEQGRWHHCSLVPNGDGTFRESGCFNRLEDEMCSWVAVDTSQPSPGRIDAQTWSAYGLGLCQITGGRVHGGMKSREA